MWYVSVLIRVGYAGCSQQRSCWIFFLVFVVFACWYMSCKHTMCREYDGGWYFLFCHAGVSTLSLCEAHVGMKLGQEMGRPMTILSRKKSKELLVVALAIFVGLFFS